MSLTDYSDTQDPRDEKPRRRKHGAPSFIEKIALALVFLAVLEGLAFFMFGVQKPTKGEEKILSSPLPAKGFFITLESVLLQWQDVREKKPEIPNGMNTPMAKVKISGSGSGFLKVIFRDEQKALVGRIVSVPFNSGLFENQANEIEIYATEGANSNKPQQVMKDRAGGGLESWTVEINEAQTIDQASKYHKNLYHGTLRR